MVLVSSCSNVDDDDEDDDDESVAAGAVDDEEEVVVVVEKCDVERNNHEAGAVLVVFVSTVPTADPACSTMPPSFSICFFRRASAIFAARAAIVPTSLFFWFVILG